MAIFRGRSAGVFVGLALVVALGLAGCGAAGTGGAGGAYGGGASTATSTSAGGSSSGVNLTCASGATVCTKTVSVGGQSKTVLADTKGMTLYYFTPDSASTVACTGACAQTWPPLSVSTSSVTGTSLTGSLTALNGADGEQAEYNGHPLYRYSGDKSQSDANGEGIGGKWFVATPALAAGAGAAAGSSPTNTPSGSGPGGY